MKVDRWLDRWMDRNLSGSWCTRYALTRAAMASSEKKKVQAAMRSLEKNGNSNRGRVVPMASAITKAAKPWRERGGVRRGE